MTVGLLTVDCFIPESLSLKDKRHVLRSISERIRREFNVSICEADYQDQWQRTTLAVAVANTEWPMARRTLHRIVEFLERERRLNVLNTDIQQLY
ncbi:MAG: DUF503 domain-containing protein [candidate division WOR-3 bacterium]